jgi:gas vesicle protein
MVHRGRDASRRRRLCVRWIYIITHSIGKGVIMRATRIIAGALLAMAAGAALGVLFAPDKGSTTRRRLSDQGTRYLGAIKNTAGEYAESLEETYENARGTAVDIAGRVKGAVDVLGGDGAIKHGHRT